MRTSPHEAAAEPLLFTTALNSQRRHLRSGDVMSLGIERLGEQTQRVVEWSDR
jgi:2-keto-4-pentenoate hydratase/2-oxohepta-3-ene-1,7-dioic acid hydratase in catechol pathway